MTDWADLHQVLGPELLAGLIGISEASMRHYVSGTRPTPDAIAIRLHFLALVVADLKGAYNDIGVRRWFQRPREQLGQCAPTQLLVEDWWPKDEGPRRVRALAANIAHTPAT